MRLLALTAALYASVLPNYAAAAEETVLRCEGEYGIVKAIKARSDFQISIFRRQDGSVNIVLFSAPPDLGWYFKDVDGSSTDYSFIFSSSDLLIKNDGYGEGFLRKGLELSTLKLDRTSGFLSITSKSRGKIHYFNGNFSNFQNKF